MIEDLIEILFCGSIITIMILWAIIWFTTCTTGNIGALPWWCLLG